MASVVDHEPGKFFIPAYCSSDASATKHFYGSLFGWDAKDMGGGSHFQINGEPVAGMYQASPERLAAGVKSHWNSYLAVADVAETVSKCEALGGKVLMQPVEMEDAIMANLQDPTGVKFSVWQFKGPQYPTRQYETHALSWTELYTPDTAVAGAFYQQLVGWKLVPFEGGPTPYTVFNVDDRGGCGSSTGGMVELTKEMEGMPAQWVPYFIVEDVDKTTGQATELGGQVFGPWDIPTIGRIALILDNQHATFAVIRPEMPA